MKTVVTIAERYQETIPLTRAIRFPVELIPPEGFDPERLETWPKVEGRLEYVDGRLLYKAPCGDLQQDTVADVVAALTAWVRTHRGYVVGTNEAGMLLQGAARGADAAVWRRDAVKEYQGKFRRVAPLLAVEVAGEDEDEPVLREKARWYLNVGVKVVWIVLPESRAVVVISGSKERRCRIGESLPPEKVLPGLSPRVDEFFIQIAAE